MISRRGLRLRRPVSAREGRQKGRDDRPLPGIHCPRCGWQPRGSDRWRCACGKEWNTFRTRAKCPRCALQWQETACLQCQGWSRHADWYEAPRR